MLLRLSAYITPDAAASFPKASAFHLPRPTLRRDQACLEPASGEQKGAPREGALSRLSSRTLLLGPSTDGSEAAPRKTCIGHRGQWGSGGPRANEGSCGRGVGSVGTWREMLVRPLCSHEQASPSVCLTALTPLMPGQKAAEQTVSKVTSFIYTNKVPKG